jgi:hypothetical protein
VQASVGKSLESSVRVAATMSWSVRAIQLIFAPASGEQGANTSSSMDRCSSLYSLKAGNDIIGMT